MIYMSSAVKTYHFWKDFNGFRDNTKENLWSNFFFFKKVSVIFHYAES